MSRIVLSLWLGMMLVIAAPASEAARFRANLTGPAENPGNTSPGVGTATVDFDTATHRLHVNTTFSGLTTGTTAAHIHCCITVPNGNAGVATTTPTFPGFPLGVTSATYDVTLDTTLASSWNPAYITANGGTPAGAEAALANGMNNGLSYLNIHTTQFPSGEIRGFLGLVDLRDIPTLSEWALPVLAAALGLLAWARMRRRAR
jgi:hypothetical protein